MAFVSNSGYTAIARRAIYTDGDETSKIFTNMALGRGSGGTQDQATLSDEWGIGTNTLEDTGMTRVTIGKATATTAAQGAGRTITTATGAGSVNGDTCWFRNTWTCGVSSIATGVKECGVFNSTTGGDMLAYGTFPTAIPMGTGDTLQVTWSVQVKSG